jgi:hypothetical protein
MKYQIFKLENGKLRYYRYPKIKGFNKKRKLLRIIGRLNGISDPKYVLLIVG